MVCYSYLPFLRPGGQVSGSAGILTLHRVDSVGMKNPHVGQRVWAEKLSGTFVILSIDEDRVTADIQSTNGSDLIERKVSLRQLHALGGDASPTSRD